MNDSLSEKEWPLHCAIFDNNCDQLQELIDSCTATTSNNLKTILEKEDSHGRTPLMLSIRMKRQEMIEKLLFCGANANAVGKDYWSVVDEAICTGDRNIVQLCKKFSRYESLLTKDSITCRALVKFSKTKDFYIEMKWRFSSWIPFVSDLCPSDSYKIYKSADCIRIDFSFDSLGDQKGGKRSLIFKSTDNRGHFIFLDIDHKNQRAHSQTFVDIENDDPKKSIDEELLKSCNPSLDEVQSMLDKQVQSFHVDLENVSFDRKSAGFPWIGQFKEEEVDGYQCKVFGTSSINLITKTRREHLSEENANEANSETDSSSNDKSFPLLSWLNSTKIEVPPSENASSITKNQYLNPLNEDDRKLDVGQPKKLTIQRWTFSATLSLCDNYPLDLVEQILPIIDMMASQNAHFARLKEFLTLRLPGGFPLKIEIPLYHLINAVVTFENVHSEKESVTGVTFLADENGKFCALDDTLFNVPVGYSIIDVSHDGGDLSVYDDQLILLQSMMGENSSSENDTNAIRAVLDLDDLDLARAIEESSMLYSSQNQSELVSGNETLQINGTVDDLTVALNISLKIEEERKREEERELRELEEALEISRQQF